MKTIKLINPARIMMALTLLFAFSFTTVSADTLVKESKSIVEIAVSNDNFSILVDALVKANLVDALSAEGPFTVFAPTNDAFEALFNELGVDGIADLTKDQLTPILLYHVVNGKVMSAAVSSGKVSTLNQDNSLNVIASSDGVQLNGNSSVIMTDIQATNGVIHVIDAVLVPMAAQKTSKSKKSSCN